MKWDTSWTRISRSITSKVGHVGNSVIRNSNGPPWRIWVSSKRTSEPPASTIVARKCTSPYGGANREITRVLPRRARTATRVHTSRRRTCNDNMRPVRGSLQTKILLLGLLDTQYTLLFRDVDTFSGVYKGENIFLKKKWNTVKALQTCRITVAMVWTNQQQE